MKEQILNNINLLNKEQQENLLYLFNETNTDFFDENYKNIMESWHEKNREFDIPNTFVSISINGNSNYYSNTNVLSKDTIFDIASMSKIYTEFILFGVIEEYGLSLQTKIKDIVDLYKDLEDLTLMDLISFNNTYKTKIDTRECTNYEDAINALRTAYIEEDKKGYYLYTDLPIMILTDILEEFTGMKYKDLFNKYIIEKYKFKHTYLEVDNDKYLTNNKGYTNDPKANIMGGYYGHCGVKTTADDLSKFLDIVLSSKYLNLYITPSETLDKDGTIKKAKALIGNSNLSVSNDNSLASIYLPSNGFAIQGSVRCHAESCIFEIYHKRFHVVSCIFTDLYTQIDNIHKYEVNNNIKISGNYKLKNGRELITCDVRKVLSYDNYYKELVNMVGKMRIIELYNFINNK